ncbi:MAG: hypothetical protein Fues2KO_32210 [Fuerstiella sp.]
MGQVGSAMLLLVVTIAGCNSAPIRVADHAVPLVRETEGRNWLTSKEIVRFAEFEIANRQQGVQQATFREAAFTRDKLRKESSIQYTLRSNGVDLATVEARSVRKMTKLPTKIGNISSDKFDVLDGQIQLASGKSAKFALMGFNSRNLSVKAEGAIDIDAVSIQMREVDAPWNDARAGFAGVEFFLNDRRVGQVLVRRNEHVWVEQTLPEDVRTVVNAMCGLLLIARQLDTHQPHGAE